jgi:hypothetical protein
LEALTAALALVPPDATVSAQSAILPHLSARRHVFEFPELNGAEYVLVDPGLHVSSQGRMAYAGRLAILPAAGYKRLFDGEGVQVWRLIQ